MYSRSFFPTETQTPPENYSGTAFDAVQSFDSPPTAPQAHEPTNSAKIAEQRQQTTDQIIDRILSLPEGTRFMVMAPVVRAKKEDMKKFLKLLRRADTSE